MKALAIMALALLVLSGCSGEAGQEFGSADLLLAKEPKGLSVTGMEGMESSPEGSWRWIVGPLARMAFISSGEREYILRYSMNNPLPGQRIELRINGAVYSVHDSLKADPWLRPSVKGMLQFRTKPGTNILEWTFSIQNHVGGVFAESDKRPLSQALLECRMYPASSR